MTYEIEGDGRLTAYTPAQLGEPAAGKPLNNKSRERFDLVVKDANRQVLVLDACSWSAGFRRTQEMLRAGIDAADIFGVPRFDVAKLLQANRLYPAHWLLWAKRG